MTETRLARRAVAFLTRVGFAALLGILSLLVFGGILILCLVSIRLLEAPLQGDAGRISALGALGQVLAASIAVVGALVSLHYVRVELRHQRETIVQGSFLSALAHFAQFVQLLQEGALQGPGCISLWADDLAAAESRPPALRLKSPSFETIIGTRKMLLPFCHQVEHLLRMADASDMVMYRESHERLLLAHLPSSALIVIDFYARSSQGARLSDLRQRWPGLLDRSGSVGSV